MWEYIEKASVILAIVIPVFSLLAYMWKLRKQNAEIKKELNSLKEQSGAFLKSEHILDAIFPNAEAAKTKILDIIGRDSDRKGGVLRIDNMGLDLETVHAMFRYTFNEKFSGRSINYRGLIVDPENERVKKIANNSSNLDLEIATKVIEDLNNPDRTLSEHLRNSEISITKYPDFPLIHGFLIDVAR